jgi:hypothetical protein
MRAAAAAWVVQSVGATSKSTVSIRRAAGTAAAIPEAAPGEQGEDAQQSGAADIGGTRAERDADPDLHGGAAPGCTRAGRRDRRMR